MVGNQRGNGVVVGDADIVLSVPLQAAHLGQEPLHLLLVGDQAPIEVARVPVDEDAPHVEDHGIDVASGRHFHRVRGSFRDRSDTRPIKRNLQAGVQVGTR